MVLLLNGFRGTPKLNFIEVRIYLAVSRLTLDVESLQGYSTAAEKGVREKPVKCEQVKQEIKQCTRTCM